jgi:aspartate/methionine/tyrosine aminotransferase
MSIPIFKLEDYLAQYEFSIPYFLCASDPESFSMQEILAMAGPQEKALWDNLHLGYTETQGFPLLRQEIATALYPSMQADNILCFAGAEEGIFCALYALSEPGNHVIVLTPCYQSLAEIPRSQGAHVTEIPLLPEQSWRIDIERIQRAITPSTSGIIINFPHNPTGQVITQQELDQLIEVCKKHDLWLFSDEVYRLLGSPKTPWARPAAEIYPKALSLGVMSKAFGMAGLRIGWIACQDEKMLKRIGQVKNYTSICNSAPSEILSLIALKNKDQILIRNNQILSQNLDILDRFIQQHNHLFSWERPQGGCVGFVEYKGPGSINLLAKELVEEIGVLIMPASFYNDESQYFRVGFGRKNMAEALHKLKEFLLRKDLL